MGIVSLLQYINPLHVPCHVVMMVLQYEDQVRSLKLDLEALTGGIDDRDADITLLRNQLSDQELLLTKAEAQHSVCKQEVLNRDSDINELKTRYAENEQKVFSIQQELAISKNTLAGELLKTKQTYADMESTRKQLEHSRIQNCEMQDQLRSVEDIAEALRTDLKHCSLKLDKQAVECRDSIEILQVELDGCKKSLIHEQERFSESARTINSLQNKNNEKDEQISKSKKIYEEKSELENKLAIALQNIDQINAQLTLKEESECNLGESLSVSQFKLDGCSTQLEASQLRNRQLEQTLTKVSKDSEDKDDVIAELNNNLDILQSEYEEADLTSKAAQGTCDDLTGEIKYLHSQLSAVKQSSRDSDALVLTLRQDLDNAISENDRNIESAQNYQNKLISYQKRHTHSNDKFEEISENEKRLTYELENATHEIKINEKKRLEYNEDVMKMKVELASVQERKAQGDNEPSLAQQMLANLSFDHGDHSSSYITSDYGSPLNCSSPSVPTFSSPSRPLRDQSLPFRGTFEESPSQFSPISSFSPGRGLDGLGRNSFPLPKMEAKKKRRRSANPTRSRNPSESSITRCLASNNDL